MRQNGKWNHIKKYIFYNITYIITVVENNNELFSTKSLYYGYTKDLLLWAFVKISILYKLMCFRHEYFTAVVRVINSDKTLLWNVKNILKFTYS